MIKLIPTKKEIWTSVCRSTSYSNSNVGYIIWQFVWHSTGGLIGRSLQQSILLCVDVNKYD